MIYYLYVFAIPLLIAFLGYFFEGKPSKSREWVNFLFKFLKYFTGNFFYQLFIKQKKNITSSC